MVKISSLFFAYPLAAKGNPPAEKFLELVNENKKDSPASNRMGNYFIKQWLNIC